MDEDEPIEKTADDARQGVTLHVMRFVLGFGIAGAVLALLVTVVMVSA